MIPPKVFIVFLLFWKTDLYYRFHPVIIHNLALPFGLWSDVPPSAHPIPHAWNGPKQKGKINSWI